MTREAVIVELLGDQGDVVRYTCNDSDAIAKGQLLVFDTVIERKISGANLAEMPAAGIAASEKVANDGQLTIGVYTSGIFDLTLGVGGAVAGSLLKISGANYVIMPGTDEWQSGLILCKALLGGSAADVVTCKLVGV